MSKFIVMIKNQPPKHGWVDSGTGPFVTSGDADRFAARHLPGPYTIEQVADNYRYTGSASLVWTIEDTGGGCRAFTAYRNDRRYLITEKDGSDLPTPTEPVQLGIYADDDDGTGLYNEEHPNSLAAVMFAEGWKPQQVGHFIGLVHWHGLANEILNMDADSHVGKRVIALCKAGSQLIGECDEESEMAAIRDAVQKQVNVWLRG